jgi:SAM-dependent methyltransferase
MLPNEKKFYEIQEYWNIERYRPVEFERAAKTINWLPQDTVSILDIGCGNGIITNQISMKFVVGVDRSAQALKHVIKKKCQADICNLPFFHNSFDTVLCSEVIEHLPYHNYYPALRELTRIASKYILITVPYKEDLRAVSVVCPSCSCSFHPTYHMRSYSENELKDLFVTEKKPFTLYDIATIGTNNMLLIWPTVQKIKRIIFPSRIDYPLLTICPQCGFKNHDIDKDYKFIENQKNKIQRIKQLIRHIWPKKSIPKWWIVLYRNLDR